jgi:hypothetical protein
MNNEQTETQTPRSGSWLRRTDAASSSSSTRSRLRIRNTTIGAVQGNFRLFSGPSVVAGFFGRLSDELGAGPLAPVRGGAGRSRRRCGRVAKDQGNRSENL